MRLLRVPHFPPRGVCGISPDFSGLSPATGHVPMHYSPVRHSTQELPPFRVRLACVKHAASVQSEPGSNSSVQSIFFNRDAIAANGVVCTTPPRLTQSHCKVGLALTIGVSLGHYLWRCFRAPERALRHHWLHPAPTPIGCLIFKERWLRG